MQALFPLGDVDLLDAYHLCGGRVVTFRPSGASRSPASRDAAAGGDALRGRRYRCTERGGVSVDGVSVDSLGAYDGGNAHGGGGGADPAGGREIYNRDEEVQKWSSQHVVVAMPALGLVGTAFTNDPAKKSVTQPGCKIFAIKDRLRVLAVPLLLNSVLLLITCTCAMCACVFRWRCFEPPADAAGGHRRDAAAARARVWEGSQAKAARPAQTLVQAGTDARKHEYTLRRSLIDRYTTSSFLAWFEDLAYIRGWSFVPNVAAGRISAAHFKIRT